MSYSENVLGRNENIIHEGKITIWSYLPGVLWLVLFTVITFLFVVYSEIPKFTGTISGLIGVIPLIGIFLENMTSEYVITNKRIIVKNGILSLNVVEVSHSKVETIQLSQTILGRIFNYGNLVINGTGGDDIKILNISSPIEFRKKAMDYAK